MVAIDINKKALFRRMKRDIPCHMFFCFPVGIVYSNQLCVFNEWIVPFITTFLTSCLNTLD